MNEQLIFVTINWDESGDRRAEAFGPWIVREDGSHLDDVTAFLKRWHATEGKAGVSVTMWLATSPEAYDQRVQART